MSGANPLTPIADRLGKLIARSGSDHDAEKLAAVSAISRTLAANGLGFCDLADAVAGLGDPGAGGDDHAPSWATLDIGRRVWWLDRLLASNALSAWESQLARNVRTTIILRPYARQSVKQVQILDELLARHAGDVRRAA